MDIKPKTEVAVFGGGCFWCIEAAFLRIRGVISTQVGYAGGYAENPTYEAGCIGIFDQITNIW